MHAQRPAHGPRHRHVITWFCGIVLATGACLPALDPGTNAEPIELDLRLRLRPSCGFNISEYDTQCLQALMLIVKTDNGDKTHCTVLSNPPDDIQTLVFESPPQIVFGELTSTGVVTFLVRGLHNKNPDLPDAGPASVCADYRNSDNWLFFGESAPFDLGSLQDVDAGDVLIEIPVDCRDCDQGCVQLGQPICPTNPISFCVPGSATLNCEKPCQDNTQCFEDALTCTDERCDQETAEAGRYCERCTSDDDCIAGQFFCVGLPGETEGLCAPRCPLERCRTGARCNRLGNRLRRIGAVTASPVDAGT